MPADDQPTINDFLARLYTIRDAAADRLREETGALTTRNAARGMLRSRATLKAVAGLIEKAFDAALTEMLATLRHMKSVPEIDYQACRDQAFLRARPRTRAARCRRPRQMDRHGGTRIRRGPHQRADRRAVRVYALVNERPLPIKPERSGNGRNVGDC
jgi:hypothetical protein